MGGDRLMAEKILKRPNIFEQRRKMIDAASGWDEPPPPKPVVKPVKKPPKKPVY